MIHTRPTGPHIRCTTLIVFVGSMLAALLLPARAEIPAAIALTDQVLVATFHAGGAQVYECLAATAGKLAGQFREPIATLFADGKTVGRHYNGPSWELADGSVLVGKVAGRAPGATPEDIPLLKLDVISRRGNSFAEVTTIQRINTRGGVADDPCVDTGKFLSVPYSADYVFFRRARWSLISHSTPGLATRDTVKN